MAMRYADTLSQPRALVPELDRLKEQVAYLKFWQVLHRQIERRIDQIGKL